MIFFLTYEINGTKITPLKAYSYENVAIQEVKELNSHYIFPEEIFGYVKIDTEKIPNG